MGIILREEGEDPRSLLSSDEEASSKESGEEQLNPSEQPLQ